MKIGFTTVASKNYLAHVRTLVESIREHHGDCPVYVLFADEIDGCFDPAKEDFHTLELSQVLPESRRPLTFYYTPFELCCALRPFLHRYLLDRTDLDAWLFLDSDILVTAPLTPVMAAFASSALLLSPHSLHPPDQSIIDPVELTCFTHGTFNGGFLGVGRSDWTSQFLTWFEERLVTYGFAYWRGAFVDQRWLNFIPVYFPGATIVRTEGLNIGYWNLCERAIRRGGASGARYTANGEPLLCMHYSHWRDDEPEAVTIGWPVHPDTDRSVLAELGRDYKERLVRNGLETCRQWPYSFATYTDRTRIPPAARRKYFELVTSGRAPDQSPFDLPRVLGRESRMKTWARRLKRRGHRLNP